MWLVRLSIFRPVLMCMVECFLLVLGFIGYQRIGVDLFPKVDPPVITITTKYPGAGPFEVESLVTKKIEESVNQIGGIERIVSTSRENISQIVIEFKLEIDAKEAQVEVRDKVARIRVDLPKDIDEPLIERVDFGDRPVVHLALTNQSIGTVPGTLPASQLFSETKLRDLADNFVKQKLQQVDGVGQINLFGGYEREIEIEIDRQKLLLWNLTPEEVMNAVKRSNLNVPGGEIKEQPQSRTLRVIGEYPAVADIADTIVKILPGGRVIKVGDVATPKDGFKELGSMARVNGTPVVLLEIKKQSEANTVKVVDDLTERLPEINHLLPQGVQLSAIIDGAHRIRVSLHDVVETIVIAAVLAVVVIYFFLGSLQSTFVTGLALPMSILTTFFALYICGFTLNIMTLLGLSLSVGLILDDAIVVRENIWKKIEEGVPPKQAAYDGTQQVVVAVVATSLTILATFLPVAFIPGTVGRFFVSFALTVCIAVSLSLFDALTMAPLLSAHLITKAIDPNHVPKRNAVLQWLEDRGTTVSDAYSSALRWALHNRGKVILGSVALFLTSIFLMRFIGFTFLPVEENGEILITFEAPAGSTIEKSERIAAEIEKFVAAQKEVAIRSVRLGNEFGEANMGSIYLRLVPQSERSVSTSGMITRMRGLLKSYGKAESLILAVGGTGGGGGGKPLSLAVQGMDNDKLTVLSDTILKLGKESVPEVVNLDSSLRAGRSEIQYSIDRGRLAAFGLTTDQVGNAIRGMFEGLIAGQYRELGLEYDIRVRLRPEDRAGLTTLQDLTIPNSRGEAIPLTAVAKPIYGTSPTKVIRINQMRAALIEGELQIGAPLATAVAKFTALVKPLLPDGFQYEFQGQAKSMRDLRVGAIAALGLGILFIYMIMASLYESFILPFSILLTLPLALVGAVLGLLITGKLLDLYAIIGIIMLMGLVTKNAILVVDYVEQLRKEGEERMKALLDGGVRRLRPIMMTTVAMIAGMLPVAIGYGEVNQARAGMGVAAIGGLVSSTLLSLLVVPCAYLYLDDFRVWSAAKVRALFEGKPHTGAATFYTGEYT